MKCSRLFWAILGAVALTAVAGCGSGGVRRIPVTGTVTLDGEPINAGQLEFNPDPAKGNTATVICMSPIKDGRYDLQTSGVTRADSGTGVPLGWYKVTFRILDVSSRKRQATPVNVNDKYKSVDTTPLEIEVKDNPAPGAYDIKMTK